MKIFTFVLICLISFMTLTAQQQSLQEKMGYEPNAKLLIIHADDAGVSHSTNEAVINAFEKGRINSTAIMVPCPWFPEIAAYASDHPEYDFGMHLTFSSEWQAYKWGGIAPSSEIESILSDQGYFYATTKEATEHALVKEVDLEMRAQIDKAIAAGIHPTHFDSHMLTLYGNLELFKAYLKLGTDYKVPLLIAEEFLATADSFRIPELEKHLILNHVYFASPSVPPDSLNSFYTHILENLEPGISELIFHLAYDNEETRAMTRGHDYYDSKWRQRDMDYIMSKEFEESLKINDIQLVTWHDIQNSMYPEKKLEGEK